MRGISTRAMASFSIRSEAPTATIGQHLRCAQLLPSRPVPFTISHAAAVLPLGRTRLPMAALMIGSMAPDFAYFLPTELGLPAGAGLLSHSVSGLFSFCWPVALCVWLLFVHVLEAPTRALLSDGWQAAFPRSDRALTPHNLALA